MGATLLVSLVFSSHFLFGQANSQTHDGRDFFDLPEPVTCTLEFDLRKFRKEKMEGESMPATFSYLDITGNEVSASIKVEARGISRRKICQFPPIRLKLKNAGFADPYLSEVKNQKLVTHCKPGKNADESLLKEFLAYKLYNVLTDKSYRVKLLQMTYVDPGAPDETETRFAFLIEQTKFMSHRVGCSELENERLGMAHLDPSSMAILSLFQFMIGNVDWSVTGLHNIKLLNAPGVPGKPPFPLPYDFDYAGLVDAPYAVNVLAPGEIPVTQRMFIGLCLSKAEYLEAIDLFLGKKEEMYGLISNFEFLEKKDREDMLEYIGQFFELIKRDDFYADFILTDCKD